MTGNSGGVLLQFNAGLVQPHGRGQVITGHSDQFTDPPQVPIAAKAKPAAGTPAGASFGESDIRQVVLTSAASVKPEKIIWFWRHWLAKGKFHLFGGHKGAGKTTLCMGIAACISTGAPWPGETERRQPGRVLIWSGEDDIADTLIPRLLAAGANLHNIHFVEGVRDSSGKLTPYDPAKDFAKLVEAADQLSDLQLLLIDPIVSAVSGDSHKNAEVRKSLEPLVHYANTRGAAVLGIHHLSKGTKGNSLVERFTGSLAFTAIARVVWMAMPSKPSEDGEPGPKIFMRVAANLAPSGEGFEYDLQQVEVTNEAIETQRAVFGEAIRGDAEQIINEAEEGENEKTKTKSDACMGFLVEALANGPRDSDELQEQAKALNKDFTPKVIRRAREKLRLQIAYYDKPLENGKIGRGVRWYLPDRR